MKSLFSSLLCASLLVFTVGCGKDNKSGGGSVQPPIHNNIQSGTLDQNSQQVVASLNSWYNGTTEGSRGRGYLKVDKVQINSNSSQNCDEIDLKIFTIPYCTYSYSSSNTNGTVISTQNLNLAQDGQQISARGNQELNSIFNGSAGTVIGAQNIGNNVSRIDLLQNNVIVSYIIDKNFHSMLNPVQKFSNTLGSAVISTYVSCLNYSGCSL